MSSTLRSTLILIVCLLTLGRTAAAYKPEIDPINESYGNFIVEAEYDRSLAYNGNDNLRLKITITTSGTTNLILEKCDSPDETKIQIYPLSNDPQAIRDESGLKTTYYYKVDIKGDGEGKEGAYPKIYYIPLSLRYPNNPAIIKRLFGLNVGVRNNGRVIINMEDGDPPEFGTGQTGEHEVELVNNFPNYPVTIRQVEIKSDPPGIILPATIPMEQRIEPLQRKRFIVHFNVEHMTYTKLLSGFGDKTYLVMAFTYDDSNDRVISDLTQRVKIKVRPSLRVLIFSMLLGVIIGTFLKYVLQHLQRKGLITGKDAVWFASSTIFIGLVVSIIALVGKMKIVFFETSGSYDVPAVIFVMGLMAAVLGAQLLSTWFKAPGQQAEPTKGRRRARADH